MSSLARPGDLGDKPRVVSGFAETCMALGYLEESICCLLGIAPKQLHSQTQRLAFFLGESQRLRGTQLGHLIKLLLFGRPLSDVEFDRLPSAVSRTLTAMRATQTDDDGHRSAVSLTPFEGQLFFSDRFTGLRSLSDDQEHQSAVMPPHLSTELTLRHLPAMTSCRVLDLGAGSGAIAIHLACRGNLCWASDVDPRALDYVRLNARLNEVEVEVLAETTADLDYVVFNSPVGPDYIEAGGCLEATMSLEAAISVVTEASRRHGGPSVTAFLFAVICTTGSLLDDIAMASAQVARDGFELSSSKVLDAPEFTLTLHDLEQLRLPGHSLLASSSREGAALLEKLRSLEVREVAPVMLRFRRIS